MSFQEQVQQFLETYELPDGFTMKPFTGGQEGIDELLVQAARNAFENGFQFSSAQREKFAQWDNAQNVIIRQRNGGRLSIGASGGQITYHITPTGMGTLVEAENTLTGSKIDLTEY